MIRFGQKVFVQANDFKLDNSKTNKVISNIFWIIIKELFSYNFAKFGEDCDENNEIMNNNN